MQAQLAAAEGFVAYYGVPLLARGQVVGVLELLHRAPLAPNPEWLDFLETIAVAAAIAIDNAQMFERLQHGSDERLLTRQTAVQS